MKYVAWSGSWLVCYGSWLQLLFLVVSARKVAEEQGRSSGQTQGLEKGLDQFRCACFQGNGCPPQIPD
jgi:hypothetical protein